MAQKDECKSYGVESSTSNGQLRGMILGALLMTVMGSLAFVFYRYTATNTHAEKTPTPTVLIPVLPPPIALAAPTPTEIRATSITQALPPQSSPQTPLDPRLAQAFSEIKNVFTQRPVPWNVAQQQIEIIAPFLASHPDNARHFGTLLNQEVNVATAVFKALSSPTLSRESRHLLVQAVLRYHPDMANRAVADWLKTNPKPELIKETLAEIIMPLGQESLEQLERLCSAPSATEAGEEARWAALETLAPFTNTASQKALASIATQDPKPEFRAYAKVLQSSAIASAMGLLVQSNFNSNSKKASSPSESTDAMKILVAGDILTSLNDKPSLSAEAMQADLKQESTPSKVEVLVYRNGKEVVLSCEKIQLIRELEQTRFRIHLPILMPTETANQPTESGF